MCRIEPDVKWLKGLLDHWEMVNYSYKCQLTWTHGLYHMVRVVIKVQKLLLCAEKINELDEFFCFPVENEERALILSSCAFFVYISSDSGFFLCNPHFPAWELVENTVQHLSCCLITWDDCCSNTTSGKVITQLFGSFSYFLISTLAPKLKSNINIQSDLDRSNVYSVQY